MVLGREVTLPMQAVVGRPREEIEVIFYEDYVMDLQDKLKACHNIARENIKSAAQYQKKHYDSNSKRKAYKPGQLVWLHDPSRKVGISSKLVSK
jgi:hypothetical protein